MNRRNFSEGVLVGVGSVALASYLLATGRSTPVESVGFVAGVVAVWLAAKESAWTYPLGLVNVAIYAHFFFSERLFADAVLNGIYFVLLCLGWYWWTRRREGVIELKVASASVSTLVIVFGIGVASLVPVWSALGAYGGSAPVIDGSLTVFSLCAQFLQDRKFLQCWIVWAALNLVYVPWFWHRQYYATSILYAIFLVLAVRGYLHWRSIYRSARNEANDPGVLVQ